MHTAATVITTKPWPGTPASLSSKEADWPCHILTGWKRFKTDLQEFRLEISAIQAGFLKGDGRKLKIRASSAVCFTHHHPASQTRETRPLTWHFEPFSQVHDVFGERWSNPPGYTKIRDYYQRSRRSSLLDSDAIWAARHLWCNPASTMGWIRRWGAR